MNGLKALVLAGGFGTRLRPLSCTRPKMLFPVANMPLLDWTLRNLSEGGVDTVILAVNYMAEALVRYLGPTKFDLGIIYSREERPLGTGGPIRKAADLLADGEPFLMLNGDIISDIDYRRLVDFHTRKGGLATIALFQVPDPSRYGAVEIDGDGRILRFVEKPEPGKAPSNLINAGIYVLDPQVIDYIPEGRSVSIEQEVFPVLAGERALYGFEAHGLWMDVGVPEDYLRANARLLSKQDGVRVDEGSTVDDSAEVIPPSILGVGVEVGANSVLGPHTSIADYVHIGRGCRIENSIIFPGATIGDYTSVRNAIIGENATLERWVKVESGSLIGDYV
ncbi:MAG: sugar phosphate nucleotidyltransferase, partial [Candidatus Bathyarchaeia archaeon]